MTIRAVTCKFGGMPIVVQGDRRYVCIAVEKQMRDFADKNIGFAFHVEKALDATNTEVARAQEYLTGVHHELLIDHVAFETQPKPN